ncbi:unnamed protein product [Closterium sp. Naga37s-1]|nr:unnamed protein product [Closterium sp. Naga37s-1]
MTGDDAAACPVPAIDWRFVSRKAIARLAKQGLVATAADSADRRTIRDDNESRRRRLRHTVAPWAPEQQRLSHCWSDGQHLSRCWLPRAAGAALLAPRAALLAPRAARRCWRGQGRCRIDQSMAASQGGWRRIERKANGNHDRTAILAIRNIACSDIGTSQAAATLQPAATFQPAATSHAAAKSLKAPMSFFLLPRGAARGASARSSAVGGDEALPTVTAAQPAAPPITQGHVAGQLTSSVRGLRRGDVISEQARHSQERGSAQSGERLGTGSLVPFSPVPATKIFCCNARK